MLEAHALCAARRPAAVRRHVARGVSGRRAAERHARSGRRRGDRDQGPDALRRARPRCGWTATSWTSWRRCCACCEPRSRLAGARSSPPRRHAVRLPRRPRAALAAGGPVHRGREPRAAARTAGRRGAGWCGCAARSDSAARPARAWSRRSRRRGSSGTRAGRARHDRARELDAASGRRRHARAARGDVVERASPLDRVLLRARGPALARAALPSILETLERRVARRCVAAQSGSA